MDDTVRIIESLGNSGILIDGVRETVKHEIKKQEDWFLGLSLGNMLTWKGVVRAGESVVWARRGNNMDKKF